MPSTPRRLRPGQTDDEQVSPAKRRKTDQTSSDVSTRPSPLNASSTQYRCKSSDCSFEGPEIFFADNKRGNHHETCVKCRSFKDALRRYVGEYGEETDLDHPKLLEYMEVWLSGWSDRHKIYPDVQIRNEEIAKLAKGKLDSEFASDPFRSTPRATRSRRLNPSTPMGVAMMPSGSHSLPHRRASSASTLQVDDTKDHANSTSGSITDEVAAGSESQQGSNSPKLGSRAPPPEQEQAHWDERDRRRGFQDFALCQGIAQNLHRLANGFDQLAERTPEQQRYVMDMMGLSWDD